MKKNISSSRSVGDVEVITQNKTWLSLNHIFAHVAVSKPPIVILIYNDISCINVGNDVSCYIANDSNNLHHIV